MKIEIFPNAATVARKGAAFVASCARSAVTERGVFTVAVSGGHTPWQMLEGLAKEKLPWDRMQVFQVDERIAPAGDPDRNMTHLRASLLTRAPLNASQVHPMPVERDDVEGAARQYADILARVAGSPAVLDLIHLGLGPDGHTASLVPSDPVLDIADRDVAITGEYQGRRRMTLTYPILNRARQILWLVTGADKTQALSFLEKGDASIPAGRVDSEQAVVFADKAAAALLQGKR